MNYIKSFKIFESDDVKLLDCLVELYDYGFEPDDDLDITNLLSEEDPNLLLCIKLVKGFNELKFSNYIEFEFDKENVGHPVDDSDGFHGGGVRKYDVNSMHIEDEIIELVDEASIKIINSYIPNASKGRYIIHEYLVGYGTCVVILIKFFK